MTAPTMIYTAVSLKEPGNFLANVALVVVVGELMKSHFAAAESQYKREGRFVQRKHVS